MENESFFETAAAEDFDEVYAILEAAFPKSERRSKEAQKALLNLFEYDLYIKRTDKGRIIAFLGVWHLEGFDFIEHAAVAEQARGGGIGSRIFKEYMAEHQTLIFLEVEEPETENARRRIRFYKNLGFHLNAYDYVQPSFWKDEEDLPLQVMTWPEALNEGVFIECKEKLMTTVYKKRI